MKNLQITAHLASSIAVYDSWTPNLESILIYQLLSNLNLCSPNPTKAQIKETIAVLDKELKLKKNKEHGFYHCSSPIYKYKEEETSKYRKRWSPDQEGHINWGKRKAKFNTSEGPEKSYDLPLFLRITPRIDWFCVGDKEQIFYLLNQTKGLGKKRSQGYGQVTNWQIQEIDADFSLIKDNALMKPLPYSLLTTHFSHIQTEGSILINWGWKPPIWLPDNQAVCVMPNLVERTVNKPVLRNA